MACCVDVHLKRLAVIEFLMAEKESVTNIYQQLENACGVTSVDKSTFSHWASSFKF